jgi:Uma2 family endonuclease
MVVSHTHLRLWTREEYLKMAEGGVFAPGERVELIEGEIIAMTPQKGPHATGITLVSEELRRAFGMGYVIRVQLPLDLGPLSEPEPDLAVVRGSARDYRDAHPTAAVLVVEVSDATLDLDRQRKAGMYAKAGIPEYWILNLPDQVLEVYRDPAPMPDQFLGYGYRSHQSLEVGVSVAPLASPTTRIAVADLLP